MIRWLASLISRLKRSRSKVILTAGFFIFNPDGKVLVCKPYNSTHWTIPKGKLDLKETPLAAALRETFEETHINLTQRSGNCYYVGTRIYKNHTKRIHAFAYLVRKAIYTKEMWCSQGKDGIAEVVAYEFVTVAKAFTMLPTPQRELLNVISRGNFSDLPQLDVYVRDR